MFDFIFGGFDKMAMAFTLPLLIGGLGIAPFILLRMWLAMKKGQSYEDWGREETARQKEAFRKAAAIGIKIGRRVQRWRKRY